MAIAKKPQQFVQTMTEKMMTYALGRRAEYYDMPTVRKIVSDAAAGDYRMTSFILGVVGSDAFRMQRATEITTASANTNVQR